MTLYLCTGKNIISITQKCSYEDQVAVLAPDGGPLSLADSTITSELRTLSGQLAASFECTVDDPATGIINRKLTPAVTELIAGGGSVQHVWGVRVAFANGLVLPELQGGALVYTAVVE